MGIKTKQVVRLFSLVFLFNLFLAFAFMEDKSKLPPKYKKWIEEEVVYIITPAEKEVFLKLETDKQRDLFIQEFWRHRDPTPGTLKNEFKDEHYRRIEYVNTKKMWGQTKLKNSWRTDRARIYITLGPPQHIEHYSSIDIYPAEIWYYQGNPKYGQPSNFSLLFFKRHGGGEFVLYNPILDGPRNLTPLAWMCSSCSTDDQFDAYAYQLISQNVSIELASASLSSFPGQGMSLGSAWSLRMPSTILVSKVHTYPHKKVDDDYAYEFLESKTSVEVSYSVYYIGNNARVDVLQAPSGINFINYIVEPEVLTFDIFEDKYIANFKASIRVTDTEEKTIFQQERNFPIDMREEQINKIRERPFHLYDSFPLIPGNYRLNLLLENTVSKEFTSFEKNIWISETGSPLMSSLVLADRIKRDPLNSQINRAFKIGDLQIYPPLRKTFSQLNKLYIFFQIHELSPRLQKTGILEFTFDREGETFQTYRKKLADYDNKRDILEDTSLEKFPLGDYTLLISLLDEDERVILSNEEKFSVQAKQLPESWILNPTYPSLDDPAYLSLLGNQYIHKGEILKGCEKLEKALSSNPESIAYALNYARALLALHDYKKMQKILSLFLDRPDENYILYKFLGIAYQGLEEYEKAVDLYFQYISHGGASFDTLNSIAICHYQLGNNREALRAWEKSLEMNPNQEELKEAVKILKEKIKKKNEE